MLIFVDLCKLTDYCIIIIPKTYRCRLYSLALYLHLCRRLSIQHHQLAKEYEEAARGLLRRSTKQRKVIVHLKIYCDFVTLNIDYFYQLFDPYIYHI